MTGNTSCWHCCAVYPATLDKCPQCKAANANIDYLTAVEQCGFSIGGFPLQPTHEKNGEDV